MYAHCTPYNVHCTEASCIFIEFRTIYTVKKSLVCSLYTVQKPMYVHCTLYNIHCKEVPYMFIVHCTEAHVCSLYTVQCTLYRGLLYVHCTPYRFPMYYKRIYGSLTLYIPASSFTQINPTCNRILLIAQL